MTDRQRAFVGGAAAAFGFAVGLVYAWRYVAPFVFAVFLAAIIDPAVGGLSRRASIGRGPAIVVVLTFALATAGGLVFAVAYNLSAEMELLTASLPRYGAEARAWADGIARRLDALRTVLPPPLADGLPFRPEQWTGAMQAAAKSVLGLLGKLPEAMFGLFIGGLATYFISKDRHALWRTVLRAVPPEWRGGVVRFRDEVVGGAFAIVRAQFILVGLTAAASVFFLSLARVSYAWGLGLLAGLLDLAPFLGPSAVFLPAALARFVHGNGAGALLLLTLWMVLVLIRQTVEPRLLGAGLGLHPVTTLAALYVGVQAVGAAGVVAGPLLLIVVKAVFIVAAGDRGADR